MDSYEVFHIKIPDHVLALIRLKNGTRLTMLCRLDADGIQPLPQSVFARGGTEAWYVMVEPKIRKGKTTGHALMRLEFRIVAGRLVSRDGRALKKMEDKPYLTDRSKS